MSNIKDVAKLAGVAVGTVSRYLNGAEIKGGNKLKVENAIKTLEFKVNPIARCLKTNQTKTIGIMIPNFSDIYATSILRNIEKKLYDNGYNIFACDSWGNINLEKQKVELLIQKMVDGLIVYPCSEDNTYLNKTLESGIPVLTVDTFVKGFKGDQILTDNVNATYTAVEWLINNGHKRIGIITGVETLFTASERLKGYKRVHEDYSLNIDNELVKAVGFDEKSGHDSIVALMKLENPPTAIIACNYYTTIGAMEAIYDLGIKIPDQLSLIGFDNLGLTNLIRPALSIIVQPMEEIGTKAAEILLKRISNDYKDYSSILRLKTEFILKDSTKAL